MDADSVAVVVIHIKWLASTSSLWIHRSALVVQLSDHTIPSPYVATKCDTILTKLGMKKEE